jgi:hypothetical protein
MHRSRAPGTFFVAQSWADSTTEMPGFNLRQHRLDPRAPSLQGDLDSDSADFGDTRQSGVSRRLNHHIMLLD